MKIGIFDLLLLMMMMMMPARIGHLKNTTSSTHCRSEKSFVRRKDDDEDNQVDVLSFSDDVRDVFICLSKNFLGESTSSTAILDLQRM